MLLLGLVVAGCGNEKEQFRVDKLNPAIRQVGDERSALADLLRTSEPNRAADARALRAQLGRLRIAMRRLAALHPPGGVGDDFRRYTRANDALLASLAHFVDVFADGNAARRSDAAARTQRMLGRAQRAQVELQHRLQ